MVVFESIGYCFILFHFNFCLFKLMYLLKIYGKVNNHYSDAIMSGMASQITSVSIVYLNVNLGGDQRKHQSSTSLAFLCEGNPLVISGLPSQRASNMEKISIWWRHHDNIFMFKQALNLSSVVNNDNMVIWSSNKWTLFSDRQTKTGSWPSRLLSGGPSHPTIQPLLPRPPLYENTSIKSLSFHLGIPIIKRWDSSETV